MQVDRISGERPVMTGVATAAAIPQMEVEVAVLQDQSLAGNTDIKEFVPVIHFHEYVTIDGLVNPHGVVRKIQRQFVGVAVIGLESGIASVLFFGANNGHRAGFRHERHPGIVSTIHKIDPCGTRQTIRIVACRHFHTRFVFTC